MSRARNKWDTSCLKGSKGTVRCKNERAAKVTITINRIGTIRNIFTFEQ